jgi:hypothetical protein
MLDAVYARLEMKREAGTSNVIHRYAGDTGGMHRAIEISRLQNPSFEARGSLKKLQDEKSNQDCPLTPVASDCSLEISYVTKL